MPHLYQKYYYKEKDRPYGEQVLIEGYHIIKEHPLFGHLDGDIHMNRKVIMGKKGACIVDSKGNVYANTSCKLTSRQWAFAIAHCLLHLCFGHFDYDKLPESAGTAFDMNIWNKACDIYITRFLYDIHFGDSICPDPASEYRIKTNDEIKIYEHLVYAEKECVQNPYSTNIGSLSDMTGLNHPIIYKKNEENEFAAAFSISLHNSVSGAVSTAGGHNWNSEKETPVRKASEWFLTHYPLLGGMASSFKIIEDTELCQKYDIHIAAVDASIGEIYVNPTADLSVREWQFVLAHEYLHAGLMYHKRAGGRNRYLWNVACDFVINGWLTEMQVGSMPQDGLLYDKELAGLSAEAIYDLIVKEMRKFRKHATFRGFGKGDIMSDPLPKFGGLERSSNHMTLDEFFKNALREGLDFHSSNERGYLPAGLVDEIRSLTSPPIPWDVELGEWFDCMFPPLEKHRSYARPSRRQGATPDIPRPRYIIQEQELMDRTFGVVVDTSGSVSVNQLGLALGSIASYAASKDVLYVRVVFCDADAYDAGYLSVDELAGKVKVTGRGGTILQPGVNLLEKAKDFPDDGPILIITDGFIEDKLYVHREHAYLLPKGNRLPFAPKGKVFYFKGRGDL